jgi:hypothetical protein
MSKFVTMLKEVAQQKRPMALIASLPRNDPELAQAILDAGADVVKIHINLHHHASDTHFGTLDEERAGLEGILKVWKGRPVGIVPFASPESDAATYQRLAEMGFDFFSLYLGNAVVGCLPPPEVAARMLALSVADSIELAAGMDTLPVQVCELSIMDGATYGQPFTYHDLLRYNALRQKIQMPLVVPTQHLVMPAAVPELARARIEGLMIGAVVAGKTVESWKESVRSFRQAIDRAIS